MASNAKLLIALSLINSICISLAFDTRPLLDFCVADPTGKACKDPKTVTADDFFFSNLNRPRNTFYRYGVAIAVADGATVPGFNALGLTYARVEFAPHGYLPPHSHPRASEVVYVVEGVIEVGFVTSYPDYKYYSKTLNKGDLFILPVGLVHTVRNVAKGKSVAMAALNSQNPGFIYIPDNVFAAKPAINATYLAGAFKLDEKTVEDLQTESYFM